MKEVFNEIGKGVKDMLEVGSNAGSETLASKSAGEALGHVLIEQPAKIALNMLGISMRTSLKVSALLGWNVIKGGARLLAAAPILPMPGKNKLGSLREITPDHITKILKPQISRTRDELRQSLTQAAA